MEEILNRGCCHILNFKRFNTFNRRAHPARCWEVRSSSPLQTDVWIGFGGESSPPTLGLGFGVVESGFFLRFPSLCSMNDSQMDTGTVSNVFLFRTFTCPLFSWSEWGYIVRVTGVIYWKTKTEAPTADDLWLIHALSHIVSYHWGE